MNDSPTEYVLYPFGLGFVFVLFWDMRNIHSIPIQCNTGIIIACSAVGAVQGEAVLWQTVRGTTGPEGGAGNP